MRGELSVLARVLLFLASYAPLFLLLTALNWQTGWAVLLFGLVTVLGATGGWSILWYVRRGHRQQADVLEASRDMSPLAGYLVGWLLPFIIFDPRDSSSVLSLAWLFLLLGVVYVRGNLLHLNPFLLLFGYHVWKVRCRIGDMDQQFTLLTHSSAIDPGASLYFSIVTTEIRYGEVVGGG